MEKKQAIFEGTLVNKKKTVPVQVTYGSRFSIRVRFPADHAIKDNAKYNKLIVVISDTEYEFGPCRFVLESSADGFAGILLFSNDVYNFDSLFLENKFINLESMLSNLTLVLNQKNKVKSSFRKYASDLTYDLRIYKKFLDDLDQDIQKETGIVLESIVQTVLDTEGRNFMSYFDEKLQILEDEIREFSRVEHEVHGFYLRKQVWNFILCSEFMTRTNLKPRGYVGDSEMMRMIYQNSFRGTSTFSKCLYKYSLEHPGAQAVRNRRILVPQLIRTFKNDIHEKPFRFLSVACGPADELQDLFLSVNNATDYSCTLLDQDPEALGEAAGNIKKIEKGLGTIIKVTYLRNSVRTMLSTPSLESEWGRFHCIYSMGLFDYLTPPVAKAVIEKIYSLLEPGGMLLIGNYHKENKSRWFMEYWHDWVLYYRNEDEFAGLLRDTDAEDISVQLEDTRCQMFLSAKKPVKG